MTNKLIAKEKVEASQECICCECGNKCGILKDGTFHCEHCFPKKQKVEDSQKMISLRSLSENFWRS